MSVLADQIEYYIKMLLDEQENGVLEVRRADLAQQFLCVPSQINYVLETRFSRKSGYVVESRRGGGGFVRITRLSLAGEDRLAQLLHEESERSMSRHSAEALLQRLIEEELLTEREGLLIAAMIGEPLQRSADELKLRALMLDKLLLSLMQENK